MVKDSALPHFAQLSPIVSSHLKIWLQNETAWPSADLVPYHFSSSLVFSAYIYPLKEAHQRKEGLLCQPKRTKKEEVATCYFAGYDSVAHSGPEKQGEVVFL
jgi:hypothetical protein